MANKFFVLTTLYFSEFLLFLKNNILCNARTKRVHEKCFNLKARTNFIPNSASFVSLATSYFSANRLCSNVRADYFCTLLLEVKTENKSYIHVRIRYGTNQNAGISFWQ